MPASERRPRGRPRDRGIDQRVVSAALGVIAERGLSAAAMDEISLRSGVSKATIYGRWRSKDDLVHEAVGRFEAEPRFHFSADPRADCTRFLTALLGRRQDARMRNLLPRIVAELADSPELAKIFTARILEPWRAFCAQIVRRAIHQHQLDERTDVEIAVDLLIGPIFYRRLIAAASAPEITLPAAIVDAVWTAFAAA